MMGELNMLVGILVGLISLIKVYLLLCEINTVESGTLFIVM